MGRAKRWILGITIGIAASYAMIVPAVYLTQRSLIFPAPELFSEVPAGYEQVSLRTSDGLDLAAVNRPAAPDMPTVVFFHGNGDSWAGSAAATAALAQAGYGVLVPEYRGYGSNPGQPSETGLYKDGRAASAWLTARGVTPEQQVLIGNSLGSGVATQLALDVQPAALVLVSPFSSLPDVVVEKLPWLPGKWLVRDRFDNAAKIGKITAPVLILHGTLDTMVLPAQAQQLAAANPRARLMLVPGYAHELAYEQVAQQREIDWLRSLSGLHPSHRQIPAGI